MNDVFYHQAVLRTEAINALNISPNGTYIDATFGRGGHSRAILEKLGENGRLFALDKDEAAAHEAKNINDARFSFSRGAFGQLQNHAKQAGLSSVDGILLDIGISSPQIDEASRGFSFRADAPLDMRMDQSQGETAAQFLARASVKDITEVIKNYGEERFAFQIATRIVACRDETPIDSTQKLAALVRASVRTYEPGKDKATRTFQALRIHVNQELNELRLVLPQALSLLKVGGRLVVISFHSLEDRLVKTFFKKNADADTHSKKLPIKASELAEPALKIIGKAVRASETEISENARARSAMMRTAERLSGKLSSVFLGNQGAKECSV